MLFFIIFLIVGVAAALMPRFSAALDILFIAPFLGVTGGIFIWSIAAMIFQDLICVEAACIFVSAAIITCQLILWRMRA